MPRAARSASKTPTKTQPKRAASTKKAATAPRPSPASRKAVDSAAIPKRRSNSQNAAKRTAVNKGKAVKKAAPPPTKKGRVQKKVATPRTKASGATKAAERGSKRQRPRAEEQQAAVQETEEEISVVQDIGSGEIAEALNHAEKKPRLESADAVNNATEGAVSRATGPAKEKPGKLEEAAPVECPAEWEPPALEVHGGIVMAAMPADAAAAVQCDTTAMPAEAVPTVQLDVAAEPAEAVPAVQLDVAAEPAEAVPAVQLDVAAEPTEAAPAVRLRVAVEPSEAAPAVQLDVAAEPPEAASTVQMDVAAEPPEAASTVQVDVAAEAAEAAPADQVDVAAVEAPEAPENATSAEHHLEVSSALRPDMEGEAGQASSEAAKEGAAAGVLHAAAVLATADTTSQAS